jgi:threonine synthase
MWKAFQEMEALGWTGSHRPRLVCVQPDGCAPVVKALAAGADNIQAWPNPHTAAFGLRVPSPIGGFLCLRALRDTGGTAIAVSEAAIADGARALASRTGIDVCPEGGAAWAATELLRNDGWIRGGEKVVVFNTGTGLKYR